MTKQIRKVFGFALTAAMTLSFAVNVCAAEYYPSTSYEDTYDAQYTYGGPNLVDYQVPALNMEGSLPRRRALWKKDIALACRLFPRLPGTVVMELAAADRSL